MVADLLFVLRARVHDDFGQHAGEEEPKEGEGEAEVGPVVAVLHDLEGVAVEVDVAGKVHFVEGLHGDFVAAAVLGLVGVALEGEVVLDGDAGVAGFLVQAWGHGGGEGPEGHEDGDGGEGGQEEPCEEAAVGFPGQVARDDGEEEEEGGVAEVLGAGTVGGEGAILDRRVLFEAYECVFKLWPLRNGSLTDVVLTP